MILPYKLADTQTKWFPFASWTHLSLPAPQLSNIVTVHLLPVLQTLERFSIVSHVPQKQHIFCYWRKFKGSPCKTESSYQALMILIHFVWCETWRSLCLKSCFGGWEYCSCVESRCCPSIKSWLETLELQNPCVVSIVYITKLKDLGRLLTSQPNSSSSGRDPPLKEYGKKE